MIKVVLTFEIEDEEAFAADPHFQVWCRLEAAATHVPRRWNGQLGQHVVQDNDWNVVGTMTAQRAEDYEEAQFVRPVGEYRLQDGGHGVYSNVDQPCVACGARWLKNEDKSRFMQHAPDCDFVVWLREEIGLRDV